MKKIELRLVEGEFENPLKNKIKTPNDVCQIFDSIKDRASETLLAIYLNSDLVGTYDVHSTGTNSATAFDMHDLFGRAYMLRAKNIILVHNHPSGRVEPSDEDRRLLGKILFYADPLEDLSLLDFIIIGEGESWSFFSEYDGGDYTEGALSVFPTELKFG